MNVAVELKPLQVLRLTGAKNEETLSTIRMRPKPEHFDLVADKLRDRVDVWATRGTSAKVYLVQDDDELVFSLILDSVDTLIENQDEALSFLDTIRQYLIEYSDCLLYTSPSPRDRTRSRMPSSA